VVFAFNPVILNGLQGKGRKTKGLFRGKRVQSERRVLTPSEITTVMQRGRGSPSAGLLPFYRSGGGDYAKVLKVLSRLFCGGWGILEGRGGLTW